MLMVVKKLSQNWDISIIFIYFAFSKASTATQPAAELIYYNHG